MNVEFRMPSLGADMEYGILTEWKIAPGDVVKRGDVVAVVETEKGAIDVEIFEGGTVQKLLVPPGTKVPVGEPIALLQGEGESEAEPNLPVSPVAAPPSTPMTPVSAPVPASTVSTTRRKVSPAARQRAQALKVDLDTVTPTGTNGVVTLQDVEAAAGKTAPSPPTQKTPATIGGMREVIAAAMARSKRTIPHYYLSLLVDYSAARAWLDTHNAGVTIDARMLPVVPLLKAIALAAQQVPGFSGYYNDAGYQPADTVNLGVAIATRGGGLIAPAILDAPNKTAPELMQALSNLVGRTRGGRLKSSEMSAGTLTVTSLGDDSMDAVFPVIYPPQVAIVGAGTIAERPWAVDGRVESRMTVQLSLAADHRVSDGRSGARFLGRIRDLLQTPEKL